MSELVVVGKIDKVYDAVKGESKTGREWVKQDFVVKTEDPYNNVYPFTVFGQEKVDNFAKYNKQGDKVKVSFNVSANEYNGKYFTNLNAWSIFKENAEEANSIVSESTDDLPF